MGNFDYKNICVQIRVKENLTDGRFVDFMKDWNFTMEEYDAFTEPINTLNNEHSLKIVRFFIDYKDGILLPDRCGAYEPLRHNFNKEDISAPLIWVSLPAGALLLKKRYKYSAEISNEYHGIVWWDGVLTAPKRILPEHLGKITFWFPKQRKIDMAFLEQLLRDFCSYLQTDFGMIFDQENREVLFDLFHPERKGLILETY